MTNKFNILILLVVSIAGYGFGAGWLISHTGSYIAIISILLTCYISRRSYMALSAEKQTNSNSIKVESDAQKKITSLNIANQALTQFIRDPSSTEPFLLLLRDIEALTKARSSAIFTTPDSSSQLVMLACTDPADTAWSDDVLHRILPETVTKISNNELLDFYDLTQILEYNYVCVFLNPTSPDFSFLVLKIPTSSKVTDAVISCLHEHSTRLNSIISSVQSARLKLRNVQFEERATIARELHDSLAQSLSYLKIQSSRLQSMLTGSELQNMNQAMEIDALMQDVRSALKLAYRQLRELITTFRLTMDGNNFSQALSDSVEEFSRRSGIAFDIDNRLPDDALTVIEETQLLYIIRESLSNVVRHSQATIALVSIHYTEQGQVTASIEDDGIGLQDISKPEQHFGIIIMQERAQSIGGSIRLDKQANGGTRLIVIFQADKNDA